MSSPDKHYIQTGYNWTMNAQVPFSSLLVVYFVMPYVLVLLPRSSIDATDKDGFKTVVGVVLNNWHGLKMAIEHGMGGSTPAVKLKIQAMIDRIADVCYSLEFSELDIADALEDMMDDLFDTIIEDSSSEHLGHIIFQVAEKWLNVDKNAVHMYLDSLPQSSNILESFYPKSNINTKQ